ncbi:hypothetical protein CKN81_02250 [Carnobacterium divergens]|nr:hypothetical protein CKN81_02250 [Carnobacterium divergens]
MIILRKRDYTHILLNWSRLMEKIIQQFLQEKESLNNLSEKSIYAYRCDLSGLHLFCKERKVDWTSGTIDYLAYLQKEQKLKPRTLRRKLTTYKMFFNYALEKEMIVGHQPLRLKKNDFIIPKNLPKTLNKNEIADLIHTIYLEHTILKTTYRKMICTRDIAIIELLFCTGIRIGELSSIMLENYNLIEQTIIIYGKNRKERMIYISSTEVRLAIQNWLALRDLLLPKTDHLFINKYGEQISIFGIEHIFKKYKEKANINSAATPHFLRHTFATELLNNGANIREVQEILGHSSISTTEIYTQVSTNRKKYVLEKYNYRNSLFENKKE